MKEAWMDAQAPGSEGRWEDFGKALQKQRQRAAWSQPQLMDMLARNCIRVASQGTVSKWESGKQRPSQETVEVLEDIFKLPRGTLLHLLRYTVEEGSTTKEQDPLVVEAKKKHVEGLLALVSRWEDGLQEFPSAAMAFLGWISDGMGRRSGWGFEYSRYARKLALNLNCDPSKPNKAVTVDPVIEKDPLFDSLLSHLSSRQYQPIWQAWGELKLTVEQEATNIAAEVQSGKRAPFPVPRNVEATRFWGSSLPLGNPDLDDPQWHRIRGWLLDCVPNLQHSLQRIRLRGMMPGCCDLCHQEAIQPSESA